MIDLVIGPVTEWLVKKGAEKIQSSAEFQHSRQAIREAVFREIRFNQALIAEVLDGKAEDSAALAKRNNRGQTTVYLGFDPSPSASEQLRHP